VDAEIIPNCHEWDEAKQLPRELFEKVAEIGWLGGCIGAPFPSKYCSPPGGKMYATSRQTDGQDGRICRLRR
jgi:hypothetical protein